MSDNPVIKLVTRNAVLYTVGDDLVAESEDGKIAIATKDEAFEVIGFLRAWIGANIPEA